MSLLAFTQLSAPASFVATLLLLTPWIAITFGAYFYDRIRSHRDQGS